MELAVAHSPRTVTTGGGLGLEIDFSIAPENVAHIMWALRTGLYTRKALAVQREYGSNGWDEHREAGVTRPVTIHVPVWAEPFFSCRDYGRGLSREGVRIFAEYGSSTKRGMEPGEVCPDCTEEERCPACQERTEKANETVGALGFGSKAGFCIGDTFTVTSWHGGIKSVYSSAIGSDNKGKLTLMAESDCGGETGIEIRVPVPATMISEFSREARWLFRYMRPQPEINITLPVHPTGLSSGYIQADPSASWVAVMGCVPYVVDTDQLQEPLQEAGLWDSLQKLGGALYLPIGQVEFAVNREELQYTRKTKGVLVAAFQELVQQYLDDALASLKSGEGTGWNRRHKAIFLSGGLGFKLPKRFNEWTRTKVALYDREAGVAPKSFYLLNSHHAGTQSVPVTADTRLLIHDPEDTRVMKGWALNNYDVIVVPNEGHTMEEARTEVEALVLQAQLDGVDIGYLVERAWHTPRTSSGRSGGRGRANAKHQQHTFELTGLCTRGTLSENWTKADPPQDAHCYFIISRFMTRGGTVFYDTVQDDKLLAKAFKLPFPLIYGYKTTEKRPVEPKDIQNGLPYMKWRKQFFGGLMTAKVKADIRAVQWVGLFNSMPYQFSSGWDTKQNFLKQLPKVIEQIKAVLGEKHRVVRYFESYRAARKTVYKFKLGDRANLEALAKMFPSRNKRTAPECAFDRLMAEYPMLGLRVETDNDMHVFMTHPDLVIGYIRDMDRAQI